jgi:murein DD-endopeptidase MepM/ murein hydrolase activator NlpD
MGLRLIASMLAVLSASVTGVAAAEPVAPAATPAPAAAAADPLAVQLQQAAEEKAHLEAVKAVLGSTVDAAKQQQTALHDLVTANQGAIADTLARMHESEQTVHDARADEASNHASAEAARARAQQDRRLLAQAIRMRYVEDDSTVGYVLSSQSVSDLLSRAATISQIRQRSDQLLARLRDDVATATAAEASAHSNADAAAAATVALAQQQQELARQSAHAGELIAQLGSQERSAAAEIARSDARDAALAEQIAELRIQELDRTIAAAEEAAWNTANYYLANHLGTLPATLPAAVAGGGVLTWPVPGAVLSQPFGPSPYPFEPAYGGFPHFHTGLDLAAPLNTPVVAAADGVVVSATDSASGYGNHIVLGHSTSLLSLYGHLATMLVHPGDVVHRGQPIGLTGSTGNSTGPHLHFEVRVANVPIDPTPLLAPVHL